MTNGRYNSARVFYVWQCSACRAEEEQFYQFGRSEEMLRPRELPDGWVPVGDSVYCPKHVITVTIAPAEEQL